MAILDIFKKGKPAAEASVEKKEVKKEAKKEVSEKKPAALRTASVAKGKKSDGQLYGIVKRPHISEKATDLGVFDRYTFEVFPNANKNEIKKTIERMYNVNVLAVNIIRTPRKKRRVGRSIGFKPGFKKAMVKIKAGQKIEIL